MPHIRWPYDHDWYPDDEASDRNDSGHMYPLQFEQLTDIVQGREKWLLNVFSEPCDIWLRILPGDPNFTQCSCMDANRGQSKQDCFICYGTGAVGGYEKLTLDKLATIRLDLSRNHLSPMDDDGKLLVSNRELAQWDESRLMDSYDIGTGKWLVRFPMRERYQELAQHGRRERETVGNCWFYSPIRLDDRDFFVRANGRRYKFKDVSDSTWRGKTTHTSFTAEMVDYQDAIYSVGVKGASVSTLETDPSGQIQEQLAQEVPILPTSGTEDIFIQTFDFYKLFSNNRTRSSRFRGRR